MSEVFELYTTASCPHCDRAKELLLSKDCVFTVIDVSGSDELRNYVKKFQNTVPYFELIKNGERVIAGNGEGLKMVLNNDQ